MKNTARHARGTEHKNMVCNKKHNQRKVLQHPVSTSIFLFYIIMAVVKGSIALLLLGTAAAAGAWILEIFFIATAADAGNTSSVHVGTAAGRQACKDELKEIGRGHRIITSDTPFSFGILLQETGRSNVVV